MDHSDVDNRLQILILLFKLQHLLCWWTNGLMLVLLAGTNLTFSSLAGLVGPMFDYFNCIIPTYLELEFRIV